MLIHSLEKTSGGSSKEINPTAQWTHFRKDLNMSERSLVHLCTTSCSLLFWFTLSLFCDCRIAFHRPNAKHFTLHAFICADLPSVKSCYFPWGNMNQTRPLWVSTGSGIPLSHPFPANWLKRHGFFAGQTIQLCCAVPNYSNTFQLQDEDLDTVFCSKVDTQCFRCSRVDTIHTQDFFFL